MGEELRETNLELIIMAIRDIVTNALKYHKNNYDVEPITVENLIECRDLCNKLLEFDYFEKSEDYLNNHSENNYKSFLNIVDRWEKLYTKDLHEKKKDLKTLFNLIIEESEEI